MLCVGFVASIDCYAYLHELLFARIFWFRTLTPVMAVGKTETSVALALRFGNNAMLYIRVLRLPLTPAGGFTRNTLHAVVLSARSQRLNITCTSSNLRAVYQDEIIP
jgi:hypothetical protein